MTSREYLAHEDTRVAAILALAQHSAEYPHLDDAPLELAVAAILSGVPSREAVNTFRLIAGDLHTAITLETEGAEAVYDILGTWTGTYLTADEKAGEMAAEYRSSARLTVELLVSNSDALAVK